MVRGHGDRDRRVDPRELLDRDRVGECVGAAALVLLGDGHPHQAQLGELRDELVREPFLPVELFRRRRDLVERELPYRVADEVEVHRSCSASSTASRTPYPVPPWSSA